MSDNLARIDEDIIDINESIAKKRGRPIGKWKGPSLNYRPKKWLPEFNQLVVDYVVIPGITHEMLGKKYGYTKQQICNILNSPQADVLKQGIANGIIKHNEDNNVIKLAEISTKVVQRMHDFIHEDRYESASPFVFIDKVLAIGKGVGAIASENRGGDTKIQNTQINVIGGEQAKGLMDSLNLAMELKTKEIKPAPMVK